MGRRTGRWVYSHHHRLIGRSKRQTPNATKLADPAQKQRNGSNEPDVRVPPLEEEDCNERIRVVQYAAEQFYASRNSSVGIRIQRRGGTSIGAAAGRARGRGQPFHPSALTSPPTSCAHRRTPRTGSWRPSTRRPCRCPCGTEQVGAAPTHRLSEAPRAARVVGVVQLAGERVERHLLDDLGRLRVGQSGRCRGIPGRASPVTCPQPRRTLVVFEVGATRRRGLRSRRGMRQL